MRKMTSAKLKMAARLGPLVPIVIVKAEKGESSIQQVDCKLG